MLQNLNVRQCLQDAHAIAEDSGDEQWKAFMAQRQEEGEEVCYKVVSH